MTTFCYYQVAGNLSHVKPIVAQSDDRLKENEVII